MHSVVVERRAVECREMKVTVKQAGHKRVLRCIDHLGARRFLDFALLANGRNALAFKHDHRILDGRPSVAIYQQTSTDDLHFCRFTTLSYACGC
jgi:hypothetical protein